MTTRAPARVSPAWWMTAAAVALAVWSYRATGPDPRDLVSGAAVAQVGAFVAELFPPDLSPGALRAAAQGAFETFAISLVGTVLAVAIALPLAVLTTRTLLYEGVLWEGRRLGPWAKRTRVGAYVTARMVLAVLRTIPEMVWALIFVFVVGLGPFPGVLALGVHTGGVLGKLFGESLEDVDQRPLEALQSTGAGRLALLVYGVLPQAAPQALAYALYRWEVNIRAAAMMGFVGAGGLGQRIYETLGLFLGHELLTLILTVYLMVTVVDALSAFLRARLL